MQQRSKPHQRRHHRWSPCAAIVIALPVLIVMPCARASDLDPQAIYGIADAVRAWPECYYADQIPDADKASLEAALALPPEALDVLVASDNPRHRALAVHIVYCRGDLERLRAWKHLLDDWDRGLPSASFSADGPSLGTDAGRIACYFVSNGPARFVSDVYRGAYRIWFGEAWGLDDRFPITAQTDLTKLVQPWVNRLRRSAGGECATDWFPHCAGVPRTELLGRIATLDPSLRWAVIVRAEKEQLVDAAEADAMLAELPQATTQAIAAGERLLTGDPVYAHTDAEAPLRARFLELVSETSPPSDPE